MEETIPQGKECSTCHEWKSIEDFYKHRTNRDRRMSRCKSCLSPNPKNYRGRVNKVGPRDQRGKNLRHYYNITLDDYQDMFLRQFGLCAICGNAPKEGKNLHVDHDHITGKIRGLLCSHCNHMLGLAKDNPVILKNAIKYLTLQRE